MSYECPPTIRSAIESYILEAASLNDLKHAADDISKRYRRTDEATSFQIQSEIESFAYLVARMPATYAANAKIMGEISRLCPDFAPNSLLDLGSGPGTAALAANIAFTTIKSVNLVEPNVFLTKIGQKTLAPHLNNPMWHRATLDNFTAAAPSDLVLASFVLNELPIDQSSIYAHKMWNMCADTLIIIEPGTPHGAAVITRIRAAALTWQDAHLIAPCPHTQKCPLAENPNKWCHFNARTNRTKLHKTLKGGAAGFEDEKFSYLVISRRPTTRPAYRLIGHTGAGKVRTLQVCSAAGCAETLFLSKSHPLYKESKKLDWGDGI